MLNKHKQKDGTVIPVAYMSDQHLYNYLAQQLTQLNGMVATAAQGLDPFQMELYGMGDYADPVKAARQIKSRIESLYPYFAECFLRDTCGDLRPRLQDILRREGSLNPAHVLGDVECPPLDDPYVGLHSLENETVK